MGVRIPGLCHFGVSELSSMFQMQYTMNLVQLAIALTMKLQR
jgi:hypothetical protein